MGSARFDVAVVGLGPAGARAAAAAARAGCRVIAVERRAAAGRPVQCAELVPAFVAHETPQARDALVQSVGAMHTRVEDEAVDVTRPFPGAMIDRAVFDRALVDAAVRAGARCRFGTAVRRVGPRGELELATGERIEARVLVGADGPRSAVGAMLGRRNRALVHARQFTAPLLTAHDATDVFLSRAVRGGYGWLFPKGAHALVGLGVASAERRRLGPLLDALAARLRAEGRIGAARSAWTGGAIPVGGALNPWALSDGRLVLLAGDAAGLANPVTGAGIHAALASGALSGEAAAAWLAGERDAGAEYAAELDELFGPALERALARRRRLLATYVHGGPSPADLRAGWIAYSQYWQAERIREEALA